MPQLVDIDGSILEGGGQILRTAIAISALYRIPIKVFNIRASRSRPGLMEQHLHGVELVGKMCNARLVGVKFGSTELEFWPGELVRNREFHAPVTTAGSISLLLQAALPCAVVDTTGFQKCTLRLEGGTNADMAPQIDYTTEVFRRILEKFGITFDFELIRRGYFPKGGGLVIIKTCSIPLDKLRPIHMTDFGVITKVFGWSFVAGRLPIQLAHAMADSARNILEESLQCNACIEPYKEHFEIARDDCAGIILVAETSTGCTLGGSALRKKNERVDLVGKRAADDLLKSINMQTCVDEHAQDQVILYMALANGPSEVKVGELTLHTQTAIYITEMLTKCRFEVAPLERGNNIIQCTGRIHN